MKVLYTRKGEEIYVDDHRYAEFSKHTWRLDSNGYVMRSIRIDGKVVNVYMHTEIMKTPKGMYCDHRDLNTRNNTDDNLRNCTPRQNSHNKGKHKVSAATSKYKGVSYDKTNRKWITNIVDLTGKRNFLGRFLEEEKAALAYNEAAKHFIGEFARLNQVGEVT